MTDEAGTRRMVSPLRRRRLRRRLVRHHVPIGLASALLVAAIALGPVSGDVRFRLSISTAYVSLGLLAVTLLLGPVRVLRRRPNPLSTDLRRDFGIWTALVGLLHVAAGLLVHVRGRPWLYFVRSADERADGVLGLGPIRLDRFGFANYTGLAATLILALLLALSNDLAMRRLGRRWKTLHRLNYAMFGLVVLHSITYQVIERRAPAPLLVFGLLAASVVALQLAGFLARRGEATA